MSPACPNRSEETVAVIKGKVMANRINFTKRNLEALPLPAVGARVEYQDEKLPGLYLRVSGNGTRTFQVRRRLPGAGTERITIGRFPAMTCEQARIRASEINGEIAKGENPNDRKRAARAEMTVGELYERYLRDHIRAHGKSERTLVSAWKVHLSPWANRKLSAIGKADVATLKTKLAKAGQAAGTVNRLIGIVAALYAWAQEQDLYRGENPATGVKKLKATSRERFIQADELPRFFAALAQEENDGARDYILLSLLTGARKANVLAMRWDEISFERALWTIPQSKTKTDDTYTIPLTPEALEILANRRRGGSEWVFPADSASGHLEEPRKAWLRLFDRDELAQLSVRLAAAAGIDFTVGEHETLGVALGRARLLAREHDIDTIGTRIADLRLHDLRRSLGSWQAATGANLSIIGKSLGHKNVSTTAIYARLNLDPVRDAMHRATSAMFAAAGAGASAEVIPLNRSAGKSGQGDEHEHAGRTDIDRQPTA